METSGSMQKKLIFYHHLLNLSDEALAKQMINVQLQNNFPGLAQECQSYIKELNLSNIIDKKMHKNTWKREVHQAAEKYNKEKLLEDCQTRNRGTSRQNQNKIPGGENTN